MLGQELSAFANSMGGHIVLAVNDDGTVDGVESMREKTRTRE